MDKSTLKLKGDAGRSQFIKLFKEVQRLKTQLDQYTVTDANKTSIEQVLSREQLQGFKGVFLETAALQGFVDGILHRRIFDGDGLSDLFAPQELGWKARTKAELALMEDLIPFTQARPGAGGFRAGGL